MATTEHSVNDALAELLRKSRHAWRTEDAVRSENTAQFKESSGRPDILVTEKDVSPVVIEIEIHPALTVEAEAVSRLGKEMRDTGMKILSSVAVRLPVRMRTKQGIHLRRELEQAGDMEIAIYTGKTPPACTRWPVSGWITGNLFDLSVLVQWASVPPDVIDEAADELITGVTQAAGLLDQMAGSSRPAFQEISRELCQEDGKQTRRMAAAILANAFIFHENLAGKLSGISSFEQLRGTEDGIMKSTVLAEWRKILQINYWPIFDIARRIFEIIPTLHSRNLIERLVATSEKLIHRRIMRSHDLTGAVFQRVIADRKFLAAYYTTPASAALLAGLAITQDMLPSGKSWAKADDVTSLRIADFACGTGTLLSAVYQRISQIHEFAGGNAEKLHPRMMANVLVGCDVLPAAAHLTASMLAGAHPAVKYDQSSVLTVAYGKQPRCIIALGSLDLLDPQGKFEILSITSKAAESMGETDREIWRSLPHESFDLVIMNPPFTRATAHEGKSISVPNPMFAAFGSSAKEQKKMAEAAEKLTRNTSAHGNAGEASIFLVLADRKLKPGGKLALVMPLSLLSGESWENSRKLLAKNYTGLVLVSIAGGGNTDMSFSADTGMGECLVAGCKSGEESKRAFFVILNERPAYPMIGLSAAEQIHELISTGKIRCLEDGPVGGTALQFGNDVIGYVMDAPLPASGGWNLSRIADLSLAQTAYQIVNEKRIWLPSMNRTETADMPISTVSAIGKTGPVHRDINGYTPEGEIRGPFDIPSIKTGRVPTYPVLWAHEANRERTMVFEADCEGIPRQGATAEEQTGIELKVATIWNTASHCHFNCDFGFRSQSTGMQFTRRKTIGGRAWLSIQLSSAEQEKALVLWANTTLGLLLRWWHSNKQQAGRGNVSKQGLQNLPVLDVTALSPAQMDEAVKIFDALCEKPLLPVHQIDTDPVRKELDDQFGRRVLGLTEAVLKPGGPLDILRMKLSREPSVRGKK